MKRLHMFVVAVYLALSASVATAQAPSLDAVCPNKFPNFISDICWSCMFPFKVFGAKIIGSDGEDFETEADSKPICLCPESLTIGIPVSFWEPAYMIDVHTAPGCLPTLGGLKLPLPWAESEYGVIDKADQRRQSAYRNSAYYVSPLMYLLEVVLDDACSDRSPFDVGWTSEFDPSWNDDQLALIKMPIAYAFSNLAGAMAAGVDAFAAINGFPKNEIFWQAGSWGPMYPLTGNVKDHKSMDSTGHLLATRMLASAHGMRELAGLYSKGGGRSYGCEPGEPNCGSGTTRAAMCAGSPSDMPPDLIMKKKQYKIQRIFPTPYGEKGHLGGCCVPIGRSTALREANTQLPLEGYKDFGYSIFRKRDCCAGVVSPASAQ